MKTTRVSCAALCLIKLGRLYLLEINKNRGDVLTPLGGALEFRPSARVVLDKLGAVCEKGADLRLSIPVDRLPSFAAWFRRRVQRETNPTREMREELVKEHRALPRWPRGGVDITFRGTTVGIETTTRRGPKGTLTVYFWEGFECRCHPDVAEKLHAVAQDRGSRLRLVSRRSILNGRDAATKLSIATSARKLIRLTGKQQDLASGHQRPTS